MNKYKGGKMNPTIGVILLVAGVWLIQCSLLIKAVGWPSLFYFKVIPFFIGEACLLAGLKWFSWI
jgi:hypothetical protein